MDLSGLLPGLALLPRDEPFTLRMARDRGVSQNQLSILVAAGALRRPIRNVYIPAELADTITVRAKALRLVIPRDSFVCDRSAAWLHGLPMALAPGEHLDVPAVSCFRPSEAGRLRNKLAVSGERAVAKEDLMEIDGLQVTTPLRTALDLGRLQRTRDLALAGMDAMASLRVFTVEELLAAVPRFDRTRGVCQLRALAPIVDPDSGSAGESALRLRWYDAGLPRPRLQVPFLVDGRVVALLDMGLEDDRFGAEYDGEEFHSTEEQVGHDTRRRLWLREDRDWHIEVFRRVNVYGHHQDAEDRLRAAAADRVWARRRRTFLT